ncbi:MAG TPA: 3-phosphoshikimate 1-carboxyvinyltransferase [Holophaga sp.]|nr:3-phosphoshikimate 1-carboxyvinyltransferase [Holophaga sp.]
MSFQLPKNESYSKGPLSPVKAPGSKSVCNRALLLAGISEGDSCLSEVLDSDDTRRMRECLGALGIPVEEVPGRWTVRGGHRPAPRGSLCAGASGTTLRFLLPWLAVTADRPVVFTGDPRLFERPLGGLLAALEALGAAWEPRQAGGVLHPVPVPPRSMDLDVDPTASSQFLTGLAMAAAALPGGGRLRWREAPPSASYLGLTAHWMAAFGCTTRLTAQGWEIPGGSLRGREVRIPGDWSGAAAFLCAAAVTGRRVTLSPLDPSDPQGDRAVADILETSGCRVSWSDTDHLSVEGPLARGLDCDLEQCPDLGPVLAATAALAPGPSLLRGLQTLPLKECDRLAASAELVHWLGGTARILDGRALAIQPGACPGPRPPFDPRHDHRMAFAAAVGALRCGGELLDPECVAKTLPTFWEDWAAMLGTGR